MAASIGYVLVSGDAFERRSIEDAGISYNAENNMYKPYFTFKRSFFCAEKKGEIV